MTPELLISPSELSTLTTKGRISIYINYLYNQLEKSNASEEKKQLSYKIIELLDECNKLITTFEVADAKRRSNNFELKMKLDEANREVERLTEECNQLKENICLK